MKNIHQITTILCALMCLINTSVYSQSNYVSGELLIKMKPNKSVHKKTAIQTKMKGKTLKKYNQIQVELWQVPQAATKAGMEQLINEYRNHPDIEFVEPNYIYKVESTPDDPALDNKWELRNTGQSGGKIDADIDATEAWNITTESPSIVVAVIDTGIDWGHEDLVDNIWQNLGEDIDGDGTVLEWDGTKWVFDSGDDNGIDDDGNGYIDDFVGWDFRNNDNDPFDGHSHGTHVAGIIGAQGNNSIGTAGVAWDIQLAALKFFSDEGFGTSRDAAEALNYAVQMGMPISNNSWGGGSYSATLYDAIQQAQNTGHIFVASAGNQNHNNDIFTYYPSSYDLSNIISVAATDRHDNLSDFSNVGKNTVDLAAPGTEIYSCIPLNGYGYKNGTSMATPQVAATCALLWELYPNKTFIDIKNAVLQSVEKLPALTGHCVSEGRLNLYNTLTHFGSAPNCRQNDSLTLVTLYNITNGKNWLNTWNLQQPMDTWHGLILDANGCVTRLDLYNNRLSGTLPPELEQLNYLKHLWMFGNQLTGNIPPELGNLSQLTHLALDANQLTGTIPPELGNLKNLKHLALKLNNLHGCYETNLEKLCGQLASHDIERGNNLNATWDDFCATNLGLCDPYSCQQNDSLALVALYNATNGSNWTSTWNLNQPINSWHGVTLNDYGCVTRLDLPDNQLNGTLPPELGNLEYLDGLFLHTNQLTGNIPSEIGNLSNLSKLWLFSNQLTGNIPTELGNLSKLTHIGLEVNQLTGSIPLELGNLNKLIYLGLKNNQLSGCFDLNLANLCHQLITQNISLNNNFDTTWEDFCSIGEGYCTPTTCRQSDSLTLATLYHDTDGANWTNTWNLYHPITTWHGVTTDADGCVIGLDLRNNQLKGNIPPSLGSLTNLMRLFLHDNRLTGSIPPEIGNLSNLQKLWMFSNLLTGNIPPELGNLSELTHIGISANKLTGNLPAELGNLKKLIHLGVKVNDLSGCFDDNLLNLCGQLETYDIDLSNNFDVLWDDFCDNAVGICTPTICRQSDSLALVELYKSTNGSKWVNTWNLQQPMHTWYGVTLNVSGCVTHLNLPGNLLVGNLPPDIGNLLNLRQLYLYNNGINGSIPMELGNLISLRQLWLFNNKLSGAIPPEFGNLNALTHFAIEHNDLSGELPPELANLNSLIYLGLRANQLTGCYPPELSQLCGQLKFSTNAYISDGNNFDADWEDFCIEDLGACDLVFPGDFNYDGKVNHIDLLHWGLAEDNTGPTRRNATSEWIGQHCPEWTQNINSINGKHQDGDGNGTVDGADITVLVDNYGKVHAFNPLNYAASPLSYRIEPLPDDADVGIPADPNTTRYKYIVYAGDANVPIDAHGAAFRIAFHHLPVDSVIVKVGNSFLQPQQHISVFNRETNTLDVALTRTTRSDVSTNGIIIELEAIVITQDVPNTDTYSIDIGSGSMIKADGTLSSIGSMTLHDNYKTETPSNDNLTLRLSATHARCLSAGFASIDVSGGVQPYTIEWSTDETGTEIFNLPPDIYTVTVTDSNGLTQTAETEIEGQHLPVYDENGNWLECTPLYVIAPQLKVLLQGPYNTTTSEMSTKLYEKGFLPNQQPYTDALWNYNGNEGTNWTKANYPNATVDWVLVAFQTGIAPDTRIAETAAILKKDGSLYFPNGNIRFKSHADQVYVTIRHRNHIAVMTPQPITITNNTLNYDFSLNDSYRASTTFGQKLLADGKWAMFAGDCQQTADAQGYDINGQDKTMWSETNGNFGVYTSADMDLDGDIIGKDKGIWFENNGISSGIPK